MQDLTPDLAQASGTLDGAAIARVEAGGSADKADISVRTGAEFRDRIVASEIGRSAHLSILRRGNLFRLPVLVERVAEGQ